MPTTSRAVLLSFSLAAAAIAFAACQPGGDEPGLELLDATPAAPVDAWLAGFRTQDAQRQALCARGNQDGFATWYCANAGAPKITSLEDVLEGLGLKDPQNPFAMNFAMNAESTSLVGRNTSAINPRVIVFTPPPAVNDAPNEGPVSTTTNGQFGFVALGFARGSHLVEIAAFDPVKQDIDFYLIKYGKACDPSCGNDELFTPETERNWTSVTVYGDEDLKDTPLDCLQCHEPGGTGTKRILRMQELQFPWTHWLVPQFEGGTPTNGVGEDDVQPTPGGGDGDLISEFLAAHPNEDYGGVPSNMIMSSAPFSLEFLLESTGYGDQPNEFVGSVIESEGRGPTWLALYQNALDGNAISAPSYKRDPFDAMLLKTATARYLAARGGRGTPNMSAVYPVADYGDLGFHASDSAKTGTDVVRHRCGTCHSGKFPGISRNNFDVHQFPDGLSATERERVLERIRLDVANPRHMPPAQFSELTENEIEMVETSLGAPHP